MDDSFDLETFVDLFDTAMTSDNPAIRKAFKNLMMVATLVESENNNLKVGPLRGLLKTVENLQQRMTVVEMNQNKSNTVNTVYGPSVTTIGNPYQTNNSPWLTPTYSYTNTIGTGAMGGNTASTVTTLSLIHI